MPVPENSAKNVEMFRSGSFMDHARIEMLHTNEGGSKPGHDRATFVPLSSQGIVMMYVDSVARMNAEDCLLMGNLLLDAAVGLGETDPREN